MPQLPPLNAVRSFCAVGDKKSIAGAAEDLGVSASAVSQQIKSLETWTGVQLLKRNKSSIELTERGVTYYDQLWQALSLIDAATQDLRGEDENTSLTISVLPSFASLWLVPRMFAFSEAHPDVDLSILTTNALVDFGSDEVDIAVRYGLGRYPNLTSRKVMSEAVNVVCTPAALEDYTKRYGSPENLEGLAEIPFVDDVGPHAEFKHNMDIWLRSKGIEIDEMSFAYKFTDSHIAIENVVSQNMFMLARLSLVGNRIQTGELVAPFGAWTTERAGYYVVYPKHLTFRPITKLFVSWISKECRKWESEMEPLRIGVEPA